MMKTQDKLRNDLTALVRRLQSKLEYFQNLSKKYSLFRFFVFTLAVLVFLGFYINNYKTTATIILAALSSIFLILMHYHNKVENSIKKIKTYIQIKSENIARINLDWDLIPFNTNLLYISPSEAEQDFNITEKNGLLHLVCTGISFKSFQILRRWLSAKPIKKSIIHKRQNIISELKFSTRFRERLLLVSKISLDESKLDGKIVGWLEKNNEKKGIRLYTALAFIFSTLNLIFLLGYWLGYFSTFYYQALLVYIFVYYAGNKYWKDIRDVADLLFEEVKQFSSTFRFLENYDYGKSNNIKELLSPFLVVKDKPSKILSEINFTIEAFNMGKNPFIWIVFTFLFPVDFLLAIKVENFKNKIKYEFPKWLESWQNLEAYSSLATFAYLNPSYSFAIFKEEESLLDAENLGHPLIPANSRIVNDFQINRNNKTNIITGSNMSGKSTFLRTIGINILLANSGSVVCAENLTLSRFNLFSCIKVSDSVVDGISYFYAEVKRLSSIIKQIKENNEISLVLVDEIYKGTNNIERLEGSKAFIKFISDQGVYSIISTHDLEMVNIEKEVDLVKNFHFKEIIEEKKMIFNYKLSNGPCPTTNALKIMAIEGLPT